MKTAEIRRRFLDFFASRGHQVVPSAPLLYNDPTLLFVNAGMVPFKAYFTGAEPSPYERATSVQKCVRTLDIEEVGKTTRHGTFFQMNGNFSFGDYFKAEAIAYAWELVTRSADAGGLGFDPDTIWVTVLHTDDEAYALWRNIAGLPEHRIQRRGVLDNYWHMGIPGPGGPCSEIYVDRGPAYGPDGGPVVDEDRFLEIWNLVFMQEELSAVRRKDDFDVLRELPRKNIDTGMGLERVAYLLQGVDNLYEIDEVYPVIARAAELAGKTYGRNHDDDVRLRVVADHVRSGLMLIGDGVSPGNEARGYVLRRLLRRVVRSMRLLGVDEPTFAELFPVSRDAMAGSYPEVAQDFARISDLAYGEEEAFRHTLNAGTAMFDVAVGQARRDAANLLTGDKAFQLHDTYGFPIELTLEMAGEQGLAVDEAGFRRLMSEQRARAKADAKAKKGSGIATEVYARLRAEGETPFLGFDTLTNESAVRALVREGQLVEVASPGEEVEVVLAETPFYPESGGQSGDRGSMQLDGSRLDVLDVQRPVKGLIVHKVRVRDGELRRGTVLQAEVDRDWRLGACQAHSATHVIHEALHQILGPTALQAGSFNRPGYLRLDFSWGHAVNETQRSKIEDLSNDAIRADLGVSASLMPLAEAKASGAMALFGEVYGEVVRVVDMGEGWSRELCAGTHVASSSQVGLMAVTAESSVGSGLRRVEAFMGMDAFRHLARERALVHGLADTLNVQPEQLRDRVTKMISQLKEAEREIAALKAKNLMTLVDPIVAGAHDMWGVAYLSSYAEGITGNDLRTLALAVRDRVAERPAVVCVIGGTRDKPSIVVVTTAGARHRGITAGELVAIGAQPLGGRGGGKDDIAQGGGTDASQVPAALTAIEHAIGHRAQR
ncbi:MAG: alanine--tRNA ligase [Actinomycetes bacterium]